MKRTIFLLFFTHSAILSYCQFSDSLNAKFSISAFGFSHKNFEIRENIDSNAMELGKLAEKNVNFHLTYHLKNYFYTGLKVHLAQFNMNLYSGESNTVSGYLVGPFIGLFVNRADKFIYAGGRLSYLYGNFYHTEYQIYDYWVLKQSHRQYLALDVEIGCKLSRQLSLVGALNLSKSFLSKNASGYNYLSLGIQFSVYPKNNVNRSVFKNSRTL